MANLSNDSASAAASSSIVSRLSASWPRYDVFINHRGPDVKDKLATYLYTGLTEDGLKVFLDREEMEKGDNILSQIEHAISVASVHIAILSPSYAESKYCLDELVDMINSRATIIPVFYKVDPSVLRWTVKDGQGLLRVLEQKTTHDSKTGEEKPRFSSDTIQKWRKALSVVADLSGFVHRDQDDEWKLSHEVIQAVLKKVPKTPLSVAKYPTGLDLKLAEFEKAVLSQQQPETERSEAKVVGIVGVGGVGKTTLAKAFFNLRRSDYSSSSFLVDVRENARKSSLSYLQTKLLGDLKPREKNNKIESPHEGLEKLKRDLSSCHALIVLDDVDHMDQLDAVLPIKNILRSDSLILITSRDKHLLRTSEVLESSIYILKGMTTLHSKELFCCYAFHRPHPLPEFADLVDRFVEECHGLPLSLKVFGAQVFDKDEDFWEDVLEKLHSLPSEIQKRLRISYDSLEPKVREIFLDIVCFFLGENRDKARRIWGEFGVQNLQDRCLLEVDSEYKIKMHDHIRDMGREIAKDGSLPSRLWHDDLFQQWSPVTGVHGIKMLRSVCVFGNPDVDWFRQRSINPKFPPKRLDNLPGMENLQLLITENDHLEDMLSRVQPPHLKWFRWYGCPHSSVPDWIPMDQLRVLEIYGSSSLNMPWPHHSQAVPLQLRELNICAPLSDIPKSIGQLKNLEMIVIQNSWEKAIPLERLPDEFCHLHSLKYLVFKKFSSMVSLPDLFGDLSKLEHINLDGASSLQMLPDSFGNLSRLKHLSLVRCENLTMSNRTLRNVTALEYLNLSYCYQLKELPPQIARQRSLQTLCLGKTNIKELLFSIGELCNLEHLELGSKLWEALPRGLGELKSLKSLYLRYCDNLKCLPDSFGRLTQLISLKIESCGIKYLPQELLKMNNLEDLHVSNCPLGEHPFKRDVERVGEPLLSLEGDKCMVGLKRFRMVRTETEEVFFDEGVCPNLQRLSLIWCYELRQIGGLCRLPKLRDLQISDAKVEELPGLEKLTSLEALSVSGCQKLRSIQGLGQLTKLQELNVSGCSEIQELQGLEQLTNLQYLDVSGCTEMQELQFLEHSTSLETLNASGCQKLRSIQGLGHLTKLQNLDVSRCSEIQALQGLEHLTSLAILNALECPNLQWSEGVLKLLRQQLKDGFKYEEQRDRLGCLQFLQSLCLRLRSFFHLN